MPAIKHLRFDPVLHQYWDEDDNLYTSATQKQKIVEIPFDEQYWSKKIAKDRGITQGEVLAEWANTRNYASTKGNIVHKHNEDSVNQASIGFREFVRHKGSTGLTINNPVWGYLLDLDLFAKSPLAIKYPKIFNTIKSFVEKGWKLFAEKRVYLYEYLIAGTIDLLLVKGDQFIIIDWKTNKDRLHFDSGYYKKENGIKTNIWIHKTEYLRPPLTHRENSKGNLYTLQLSTYAAMVEAWGFKCAGLLLFHIMEMTIEDAEAIKPSNAEIFAYKIEYWQEDAWRLIKHRVADHKEQILVPRIRDGRSRKFGVT